jgi:hypothetical protein
MKVKEGYRRAHLGGRATADEGVYELLSDETLKADDNAIMLKVRDVLRSYLKEEIFNGILDRARETTERTLEGNPVKAMEVLSATVGLTQEEGEVSLRHLIEGSDLTQWGMLNAVTRTAADLESYDRATDLEAMGGKIMDLPAGEWKQIAEAA